ncbi:YwmB family TATA-box binding protein [Bacillus sp. FJAT-27245]|uniref:YwmB family TATA-box binding protein n=1 Tax=Bacillus sp. FJAT-27245 TaxID=1684144 RepID=UPI0006A7C1DB|nr:YwmB family TATA-box binding protein [Bacillus sp. FJAT-27245]
MNIKLGLSIFAIIGFVLFELGNRTIVADSAPELIKLAAVLEAEDSLLKEWTVYSREIIEDSDSPGKLEEYAARLQDKFPGWEWSFSTTGGKWEAAAVSPRFDYGREYLQIISTRTPHKANAYIIYRVAGGEWNEESEAFFAKGGFKDRQHDIFRGEPLNFSCITGIFNDRMEKALSKKTSNIMKRLNAVETEAIREKDFFSISAFSPLFTDTFENGMNVQIAVRSTGGKYTAVTVGTPIITIEY